MLVEVLEDLIINCLHGLSLVLGLEEASKKCEGLVLERVFRVEVLIEFQTDVEQCEGLLMFLEDERDFPKVLNRQNNWWILENLG